MRNFFKITLTSTALLLGSASAIAENATVPEFGAIFQMKTADQASVAAAFVQFAQSECRQQAPTAIRIMAETFNGTEEPTRTPLSGIFRMHRPWKQPFKPLVSAGPGPTREGFCPNTLSSLHNSS